MFVAKWLEMVGNGCLEELFMVRHSASRSLFCLAARLCRLLHGWAIPVDF